MTALVRLAFARRACNPRRPARRDLVLAQGDALLLEVGVSEVDGAGPVDVTGARLGLHVAPEAGSAGVPGAPWQGWGTVVDAAAGRFAVSVPGEVSAGWGGRYALRFQLDYDGAITTLAQGVLHVRRGPVSAAQSPPAPFVLDAAVCDGANPLG